MWLLLGLLATTLTTPCFAQFDSFSLPPGAEYTPIPRRMRYDLPPGKDVSPEGKPDESKAFSLKEFKLGMSLDDFSKMAGPIGAEPGKVKAVCSCEANQNVENLNAEDQAAKIIQCGFWNKVGDKLEGGPYRMTVAGIQCSPDFRFIEDNGVYRLFEISIAFYSSNFKDMQAALTQKYGPPASEKSLKMTTEMGNIHKATNLIWDNGISRIRLTNVDGNNIGRARMRYIHYRLAAAYNSRVNQNRADPNRRASDDL
jgi:hypothetical protein